MDNPFKKIIFTEKQIQDAINRIAHDIKDYYFKLHQSEIITSKPILLFISKDSVVFGVSLLQKLESIDFGISDFEIILISENDEEYEKKLLTQISVPRVFGNVGSDNRYYILVGIKESYVVKAQEIFKKNSKNFEIAVLINEELNQNNTLKFFGFKRKISKEDVLCGFGIRDPYFRNYFESSYCGLLYIDSYIPVIKSYNANKTRQYTKEEEKVLAQKTGTPIPSKRDYGLLFEG